MNISTLKFKFFAFNIFIVTLLSILMILFTTFRVKRFFIEERIESRISKGDFHRCLLSPIAYLLFSTEDGRLLSTIAYQIEKSPANPKTDGAFDYSIQ